VHAEEEPYGGDKVWFTFVWLVVEKNASSGCILLVCCCILTTKNVVYFYNVAGALFSCEESLLQAE
jgi:hypothetical protein